MNAVEPISAEQQQYVCEVTWNYLQILAAKYALQIDPVQISFDLKGRSSGMYVVRGKHRYIRYNPYLFSRYYQESLSTTVPHEVAHYVSDLLYGLGNIRPHGKEWKRLMIDLGAEPRVTGNYSLEGIPVRRQKRFSYRCDCRLHQVSAVRHNRMVRGVAKYYCRQCGSKLVT